MNKGQLMTSGYFKNSSNWPVTSQPNPWDITNQINISFLIAMHMHYSCQTDLITAQQQWDEAKGQTERATCFWTFKEALMKVCWVYRCRLNSRGFQKGNLLNCPVFQPVHVTPGQQHYLFFQSVPVSLFSTVPFPNRLKIFQKQFIKCLCAPLSTIATIILSKLHKGETARRNKNFVKFMLLMIRLRELVTYSY